MATVINEQTNSESEEQSKLQEPNELIELNEEQKKFMAECEIEFLNRYTDDDLDYINNKIKRDSCKKEPPIVENWWSRSSNRRDNDNNKRKRNHDNHRQPFKNFKNEYKHT